MSIHIFTKVIPFCLITSVLLLSCKSSLKLNQVSKQKSQPTYRYQSHLNEGESVVKEDYNTILTKTGLGELIYRRIYPETNFMTQYIEFGDPQYLVISGRYIEWYDNGNLKTKGQCYDDLKEGEWIEYYSSNGLKKAEGYFLNDLKEGEWKQYDLNGVHTETHLYTEGVLQEDYFIIDQSGNKRKKSHITKQKKTLPYLSKYDKLESHLARDKATFKSINSKITNHLKYPALLRDLRVNGTTETVIEVDKNGAVKQVQVLSGICQAFTDESLRLAHLLTEWSPALCDGVPCEGEYTLYIDFDID